MNNSTHVTLMVVLSFAATGCDAPPPAEPAKLTQQIFSCERLLIGNSSVSCTEDIIGPGELSLTFRPDPLRSSWEISIRGLAALAEACEFHGSYDQTRLGALQGRGETAIVCPLAPEIDRAYHTLTFANELDTPSSALSITVTLTR